MPRIIVVTGSEGYLLSQFIENRLLPDPEVGLVVGVDIRPTSALASRKPRYRYLPWSVTDPMLAERLNVELPEDRSEVSLVHGAWTFNPTRDMASQDAVDLGGTQNILNTVKKLKIPHLFYLGSTTSFAPLADNPSCAPFLGEEGWQHDSWRRMTTGYRYSRNKALAHGMMLEYAEENPDIINGWISMSIVIGAKTRNVVSYVAESPFTFGRFMFSVAGYDPPMQFIAEEDMLEVLYRATMERWRGPVNVAGGGTVRYSEVVDVMGRKRIPLPSWVLYPFVGAMWRLGWLPFPPELLDLIRYPWVADISRLRKEFGFTPKFTSREALEQFAQARLGT